MKRLDQARQEELEPKRIETAIKALKNIGISPEKITNTYIDFMFKGEKVRYFAYSGWATGKSIKDGRGLQNLLKQLKP